MELDDTFFTEVSAAWGNQKTGSERTGQPRVAMTMLLGIRILYYLGARKIYLVGVDFRMNPTTDLTANYAFGEYRDEGAINSNNHHYRVVNDWLVQLQQKGVFKKFGLEVYNCYRNSGLRAFPFLSFEDAIKQSKRNIPEEPFDLQGWYEKKTNVRACGNH